jgi:hypothetical protein
MTNIAIENNRMVESKICYYCWYYVPDPTTNKILDDSKSVKKFPHCEFFKDFNPVKFDDTCEKWESKKLKLISVIRSLYGL